MTEPDNGAHVAIRTSNAEPVRVYRRLDDWAEHGALGERRWFSRTDDQDPARSWQELTAMGEIAVVGEFARQLPPKRRLKEDEMGEIMAADMFKGSQVGDNHRLWTKDYRDEHYCWTDQHGHAYNDYMVQGYLNQGATVLVFGPAA